MRKVLLGFVWLVFTGTVSQASPQDQGAIEAYEDIISLSRQVKNNERILYGQEPGAFATKMPTPKTGNGYRILIQNKLKLAGGYHLIDRCEDLENISREPSSAELKKKYPAQDISVEGTYFFTADEIPEDFSVESRAYQIYMILHEDFHSYKRRGVYVPRAIEEGFADAFGFAAGEEMVQKFFKEDNLLEDFRETREWKSETYFTLKKCYDGLDRLYASSLAPREKLRRRELIYTPCGAEANNATLSFWATYFRYFFYASETIERFGTNKFLETYLRMDNEVSSVYHKEDKLEKKSEQAWIKEFERRLALP